MNNFPDDAIKRFPEITEDHKRKAMTSQPSKERRVVCAAIRAADGSVLLGIRHYSSDMHAQIHRRNDGVKFLHRNGEDQGFVDQRGVYMTRREAYDVALKADQIICLEACLRDELYSEGIY